MIDKTFETKEQGLEKLKNGIAIRNQMGGAMFWNIINDDCVEMAFKLLDMGVERAELCEIFDS